jgi:hypothetical protein
MSATLTWFNSGLTTKTGTTRVALFTDLKSLIDSKSADANFNWQVASSELTATVGQDPNYLVLSRKDASAGRILLLMYSQTPAGTNPVLFGQAPQVDFLYGAYFPNSTASTPTVTNLSAASGDVMTTDTDAVRVWTALHIAAVYDTSFRAFYFDSAEAVVFGFQNPASTTCIMAGAGYLLIDASDAVYPAVFSLGSNPASAFGTTGAGALPWIPLSGQQLPGGTSAPSIRTNYGSVDRQYFQAWMPIQWGGLSVIADDILTDTSTSKAYFVPIQLLSGVKNEGFVLKFRQIAHGPGTTGPFTAYNTTGPVVAARQFNATTTGGNGYPWLTNFKL